MLGLGHKGEKFELRGQAAVHALEGELDWLDLDAEVAQIFVL